MTTAPTPSRAEELAQWLEQDWDAMGVPELLDVAKELGRLHAENERLRAEMTMPTIEDASQDWGKVDPAIAWHLIERHADSWADIGKMMTEYVQAQIARAELEARKPLPLSDEQIDAIADGMPGGLGSFMKTWGWRQFARKILDLRAPPTWEPEFDFMAPGQEELAMQFCLEIAGPRGEKGSPPDPVRLMEMCQALYKAEADARPKET